MVTGSLEPSEPISTSKEVMETVSPEEEDDEVGGQFLPFLRQGPLLELGLGVATGALVTTLGLGAAVGDEDLEEHEGVLELLSKTHVLLLTVSFAPTL